MSPAGHVAVSTLAGAAVAAATGNLAAGLACAAAGVLIDVDHLLDYFWAYGFRLDPRDFHQACEETRFERLLLALHSWELLAAGWVVAFLLGWPAVAVGALVGLTLHLIGDQLWNEPFPLTYFLAYRLWVGLDATRIFKTAERRRTLAAAQGA